jgi:hypothetical protein
MYDDLERVLDVLDPATAKYLEGPATTGDYLPNGTAGQGSDPLDKRPTKGPGRRFGFIHD